MAMDYKTMHPAEQIAKIMSRIYGRGMTTTSGGNLSYRDDEGRVWVSPARLDKAELKPEDIVCILPDGTFVGRNKPTSEYHFHLEALRVRPDLRSILHAHSLGLMSYSFLHEAPPLDVFPLLRAACGPISVARYALAGTEALSMRVREEFARGSNAAILENHGVVVGGTDLMDAYIRFERIEFCAEVILAAQRASLPENAAAVPSDILADARALPEADFMECSPEESTARALVSKLAHRLYRQKLCLTTGGAFSIRLGEDSFIMSPAGVDRKWLAPEDTVRVSGGRRERGKLPDAAVRLHRAIFRAHPEVNFVIMADAPHSLAFGLTGREMNCRIVPEAYLLVRSVPSLPCGAWLHDPERIAAIVGENSPVLLFQNDSLLVIGRDWFDSYDRVEVADYNAKSIMDAERIGQTVPLTGAEIREFEKAFF